MEKIEFKRTYNNKNKCIQKRMDRCIMIMMSFHPKANWCELVLEESYKNIRKKQFKNMKEI